MSFEVCESFLRNKFEEPNNPRLEQLISDLYLELSDR